MTGMEIDWETADRITVLNLKNQLEYLEKELEDHKTHKIYMHPQDVHNSEYLYIPALKTLIRYYGDV